MVVNKLANIWNIRTLEHVEQERKLDFIWILYVYPIYTNKFIYVLRRFDYIRHLYQELWSPDVGMVIKES